jgi:hypothetical protein
VLETALAAQRLYAYTLRAESEDVLAVLRAPDSRGAHCTEETTAVNTVVEQVSDAGEAFQDTVSVPPAYRRRLGRSYFTSPALWAGPSQTVRDRTRRDGRRW